MISPSCVATGGWCRRVFHYRPPTPMYRNSPPLCTIELQIPSLMPLKMRKVQARVVGSKDGSPAYNASKAGLIGLTVGFSAQVAERGVRVNAIMPALVESRDFGWSPEERVARELQYPLGLGKPSDIGHAVLYLVSPLSIWVSGTALHVTGGYQQSGPWL